MKANEALLLSINNKNKVAEREDRQFDFIIAQVKQEAVEGYTSMHIGVVMWENVEQRLKDLGYLIHGHKISWG
jgi:hypothetical protein